MKQRSLVLFSVTGLLILAQRTILAENLYNDYGFIFTGVPTSSRAPHHDISTMPFTAEEIKAGGKAYTISDFNGLEYSNGNAMFIACQTDYKSNRLFLYDYNLRRIVQIDNFNTSLIEDTMVSKTIEYGVSKQFGKLAFDWVSNKLYWTDPLFQRIGMQSITEDLDEASNDVIVNTDLAFPTGIAVDPLAGYLFWSDYGDFSYVARIERASLLGKDRWTLVSQHVSRPDALYADPLTKRVYWTNFDRIRSVNYTGGDPRAIGISLSAYYIDVARVGNSYAVLDYYNDEIRFLDVDTGEDTIPSVYYSTTNYFAVCGYEAAVQPPSPYGDPCASAGCVDMCINVLGEAKCHCRMGFRLFADGSCQLEAGHFDIALIVNNGNELDLLDARYIANTHNYTDTAFTFYQHTGMPNDDGDDFMNFIVVDMATRTVYFATDRGLWSVPVDGETQGATRLLYLPEGDIIKGLAYDWVGRNLYFTKHADKHVVIYPLDDPEASFSAHSGGNDTVREIVVLTHTKKLFWITDHSDLWSSNLDLSERTLLKPYTYSPAFPTKLTLDPLEERIYFKDGNRIYRSSVGSLDSFSLMDELLGLQTFALYKEHIILLTTSGDETQMIAADVETPPFRADNTGILYGTGQVVSVSPLDASIQPSYPNPCDVAFGNSITCDQICLRLNNTFTCNCANGFTLAEDGRTCETFPEEDHFLLLSDVSHDNIYQISMVKPDVLHPIYAEDVGNPAGVIYNPFTRKVIWSNDLYYNIWQTNLNGTEGEELYYTGHNLGGSKGLALDLSSLNIFYTAEGWYSDSLYHSFIGVLSPEKRNRVLIENAGHKPRGITLDARAGLLFWTDHGNTLHKGIKRANMDGTEMMTLNINQNEVYWPYGITLDPDDNPGATDPVEMGRLYWTDAKYNKIYTSKYDGTDFSIFLEDPDAYLTGIVFYDNILYYTSFNKPVVTYISKDKSSHGSYGEGLSLGVLSFLDVYNSSVPNKPIHPVCSENNGHGPCSHFCFPVADGTDSYTCACPDDVGLLQDGMTCDTEVRCPQTLPNGIVLNVDVSDLQVNNPCLRITGSECAFQCDLGYKPKSGITSLTCADGIWEEMDPCGEVRCPTDVPNGDLPNECEGHIKEECIEFTCDPGFEKLPTLRSLECQLNGTWTEELENICERKCPDDVIDNGDLVANCSRDPNEVCTFICKPRYRYSSNVTSIVCQPNSTWNTTEALCEEILCLRGIPHGSLSDDCEARIGDNCADYTCSLDIGYEKNPTINSLICKNDGTWNKNTSTLCEEKCPAGDIDNAELEPGCQRDPGDVCGFTCKENHSYSTDVTSVLCQSGPSWNITSGLCEVKCPESPIDNGDLDLDCRRSPGTTCTFMCAKGYRPTGDVDEIQCRTDSTWNTTSGHCIEITCPSTITSGSIDRGCKFRYNNECNYTCNDGYQMNADVTAIICQGVGVWSHVQNNQILCSGDQPEDTEKLLIPSKTGLSTGAIIGIGSGVGLLMLLVLLLLLVFFCCCRRKAKKNDGNDPTGTIPTSFENPQYEDSTEYEHELRTSRHGQSFKGFAFTTLNEDRVGPEEGIHREEEWLPHGDPRSRSSCHSEHVYDNPLSSRASTQSKATRHSKKTVDSRFSKY